MWKWKKPADTLCVRRLHSVSAVAVFFIVAPRASRRRSPQTSAVSAEDRSGDVSSSIEAAPPVYLAKQVFPAF